MNDSHKTIGSSLRETRVLTLSYHVVCRNVALSFSYRIGMIDVRNGQKSCCAECWDIVVVVVEQRLEVQSRSLCQVFHSAPPNFLSLVVRYHFLHSQLYLSIAAIEETQSCWHWHLPRTWLGLQFSSYLVNFTNINTVLLSSVQMTRPKTHSGILSKFSALLVERFIQTLSVSAASLVLLYLILKRSNLFICCVSKLTFT